MVLQLTDISSAAALVGTIALIALLFQIIPLLKELRLTIIEFRTTLISIRELSETSQNVVEKADANLEEFNSLKSKASSLGQTCMEYLIGFFFDSPSE